MVNIPKGGFISKTRKNTVRQNIQSERLLEKKKTHGFYESLEVLSRRKPAIHASHWPSATPIVCSFLLPGFCVLVNFKFLEKKRSNQKGFKKTQ